MLVESNGAFGGIWEELLAALSGELRRIETGDGAPRHAPESFDALGSIGRLIRRWMRRSSIVATIEEAGIEFLLAASPGIGRPRPRDVADHDVFDLGLDAGLADIADVGEVLEDLDRPL